jgi:glycopeptide antibiotics resistance protein
MLWFCQLHRGHRPRLIIAAALVVFGLLIEILQGALTATRTADPVDLMADSVGVLVGWGLARAGFDGVLARVEARLFSVRAGH